MYTILLDETNELKTTIRERIMQRSKLVDKLHFLVEPDYKGTDMSGFTAVMEYILPVSREYKTEYLVLSDELYNNEWLEYKLPLDTNLTAEAGDIELQLTFVKVDIDPDGNPVQKVRKVSPVSVKILPIAAWSNIIADSALTALDQRLIQVDAAIAAASELNEVLNLTKADGIKINEDNTLQLTAHGMPIGNAVKYSSCGIDSIETDENGKIMIVMTDGRVITIDGDDDSDTGSIVNLKIEENGDLVATYTDGTEAVIGNLNGYDGNTQIYVPNVTSDTMLIFTLQDTAEEEKLEFDIDPSNNWGSLENGGAEPTNYKWEFI